MERVVIAGTGLIGSSFGLALKAHGFKGRVVGVSSTAAVRAALERGAVDEEATLEQAVPGADLVYLAQPVSRILAVIPEVARLARADTVVTDAGSTKRAILAEAGRHFAGKTFVGGHPMAGKATRGAAEAEAEIFRGRPYFLVPPAAETMERPAVREFVGWIDAIGARSAVVGAEEHDRLVAATSHLPQLLATALAALLGAQDDAERLVAAGGPGLADMTRLALSPYAVWEDILATNGDEIERMLEAAEEQIRRARGALRGESDEARELFEAGRAFAERVPRRTV